MLRLLGRQRMATSAEAQARSKSYFMESPTEGDRLESKTDTITVGRHLLMTGLRQGMRTLDVACGSGAVARVMARIAGQGLVAGVDLSQPRLDQARFRAEADHLDIAFVRGAAESLPFADATFDYVHARMLFQYLDEPQRALSEMARVTKPGGSIVLIDLDGQLSQLYPLPEHVAADLNEALRVLGEQGFDPEVGRKLPAMCARAGLTVLNTWVEPYQVYQRGQLAPADLHNWREKLATATRYLAAHTGETQRWQDFRAAYLAALTAEDAFYYSSVVIVRAQVGPVPS